MRRGRTATGKPRDGGPEQPRGHLAEIDFAKITLSQAATLVRSTYHTERRGEVLQQIPQRLINAKTVRFFMSPETEMELREIFDHIDTDRSNSVDFEEVREGFIAMQADISDEELLQTVGNPDKTEINFLEFAALMFHVEARLARASDAQRAAQRAKRIQKQKRAQRLMQSPAFRAATRIADTVHRARAMVWDFVDEPASSAGARAFSTVILLLIVASCIFFMLDGIPALSLLPRLKTAVALFEEVSAIIFSLEFLARVASCPSLSSFARSPANWIDLVALLPYWLEQYMLAYGEDAGISGGAFRAVRLVRIFRVLKIGRYFRWMHVFVATIQQSLFPLGMVLLIVIIGLVTFSSLVYYAERGAWDPEEGAFVVTRKDGSVTRAPFDSIPGTFWFIMSTLTTVGYGDMRPVTVLGKSFGIATAIFGILTLAIPISVISTNFRVEYERMKTRQEIELEQRLHQALTPEQILQQINNNKHLTKIMSAVQDFVSAAASEGQHVHKSFATSVYKSCRTNQKRIFRELRHKERDNRQDLLHNLHVVQAQYLAKRGDTLCAAIGPIEDGHGCEEDPCAGLPNDVAPHPVGNDKTGRSETHSALPGAASAPGAQSLADPPTAFGPPSNSRWHLPTASLHALPAEGHALPAEGQIPARGPSEVVDDEEVNELLRDLDLL